MRRAASRRDDKPALQEPVAGQVVGHPPGRDDWASTGLARDGHGAPSGVRAPRAPPRPPRGLRPPVHPKRDPSLPPLPPLAAAPAALVTARRRLPALPVDRPHRPGVRQVRRPEHRRPPQARPCLLRRRMRLPQAPPPRAPPLRSPAHRPRRRERRSRRPVRRRRSRHLADSAPRTACRRRVLSPAVGRGLLPVALHQPPQDLEQPCPEAFRPAGTAGRFRDGLGLAAMGNYQRINIETDIQRKFEMSSALGELTT